MNVSFSLQQQQQKQQQPSKPRFVLKLDKSLLSKKRLSELAVDTSIAEPSIDTNVISNGDNGIKRRKINIALTASSSQNQQKVSLKYERHHDVDDYDVITTPTCSVIQTTPKARDLIDTISSPRGYSKKKVSSIDEILKTSNISTYLNNCLESIIIPSRKSLDVNTNDQSSTAAIVAGESTPIGMMSYNEIANHVKSTRFEFIQRLLRPVLQRLMTSNKYAHIFNSPVDTVALNIPDYKIKIKTPMDFGTVRRKLLSNMYEDVKSFINDVNLVFKNAMTFNDSSHAIYKIAKEMKASFETDLHDLEEKCVKDMDRKSSHSCLSCSGSICQICNDKCLKFESPTLLCHGTCGQKIKRNAVYFVTVDGLMTWCQRCQSSLSPIVITYDDRLKPPLLKRQLLRRKFDEEASEPWVYCDYCGHWMHTICALYNDRINGNICDADTKFKCSFCILEEADSKINKVLLTPTSAPSTPSLLQPSFVSGLTVTGSDDSDQDDTFDSMDDATNTVTPLHQQYIHTESSNDENNKVHRHWKASSLPRSKLSDFLETVVNERLTGLGFDDVASTITIRLTSNINQHMEVPVEISSNFMTTDGFMIPEHLPYRQKCILLFQNIDGVDVCLFCLYVQEFDNSCPAPNNSVVYIAYLDSVDYFRPMEARTIVYHEIIVGYLKWVQQRGFKTGHIWSCPPQRGDNFIFWNHPSHQRTPSRDRLNSWYTSILDRASKLGMFENVATLYTSYFHDDSSKDSKEETSNLFGDNIRLVRQKSSDTLSIITASTSLTSSIAKPPIPCTVGSYSVSSSSSSNNNSNSVTSICCSRNRSGEDVPLCLPLFEGDFFVNECIRVHKLVEARAKSTNGNDRAVNIRRCRDILKNLMSKQTCIAFNVPVDASALGLHDYLVKVTSPMDLGIVKERIRLNYYNDMLSFACDVRLTFNNAISYNSPEHHIHKAAVILLNDFEQSLLNVTTEFIGAIVDKENMDSYLANFTLQAPIAAVVSPRGKTINMLSSLSMVSSPFKNAADDDTASLIPVPSLQRIHSIETKVCLSNSEALTDTLDASGDDESSRIPSDNESESSGSRPTLTRNNSVVDSTLGDDTYGRSFARRIFRSGSLSENMLQSMMVSQSTPFDKPALGYRGALSMVFELSRSVHRLKDDLFVFKFSNPRKNVDAWSATTLSKACNKLLDDITPDTSDPDDITISPFLGTRQTFLEMCQLRHYQFDSLRRAKHSSMMLLYHLHHPTADHLDMKCSCCSGEVRDTRWHCDQCPEYDICNSCNHTTHHEHVLTPYHVSYRQLNQQSMCCSTTATDAYSTTNNIKQ